MNYPSVMRLSNIVVSKTRTRSNPRDYFDEKDMNELIASIAESGVIQPILLRPLGDKFEVVAGERRVRASMIALSIDYEIPCLIQEMSDDEANEKALIENIQRADMSPTEEAVAAARVLGRCAGNHDEAARRLGWSKSTLEKRLALLNCSAKVRTALNERKIQLGHAELLAGVVHDLQDKALDSIIAKNLTVIAVKDFLLKVSKSMAGAIFDKSNCASCQHNSDVQSALFGESLGTGSCTNAPCYDSKTEAELIARRDALKSDFPRVEIVRPGDQFKIIKIVAAGSSGVGEAQAVACRGCTNFGAVVSAVPDKLGRTYLDQCFDVACNSLKVAAEIKASALKKGSTADENNVGANLAEPGSSVKKIHSDKKSSSESKVQDSNRLKEYRVATWRTVAKKVLMSNKDTNTFVLIALGLAGKMSNVSREKLSDGFGKLTKQTGANFSNFEKALLSSAELSIEHREIMLMGIAVSTMDTIEESILINIMKFLKVDLASHWKINKEFLKLLTKSELEALASEIGIKAALGESFSKTMKLKNEEICSAFLSIKNFEYTGLIPRSMQF